MNCSMYGLKGVVPVTLAVSLVAYSILPIEFLDMSRALGSL
jgi:hypothetical protein